jgi:hypothetical protein
MIMTTTTITTMEVPLLMRGRDQVGHGRRGFQRLVWPARSLNERLVYLPLTSIYTGIHINPPTYPNPTNQPNTNSNIPSIQCSGTAPCTNCLTFKRTCIFDESLDQRRRVAAKRTADELSYHRDLLQDLFKLIREANESHALQLLDIIRNNAPSDQIRAFIEETLSGLSKYHVNPALTSGSVPALTSTPGPISTKTETETETISKLEDMRNLINVEGSSPTIRRKVMDIHYLCDDAPCSVPAKPWTNVTQDADLVSHLVSLYFAWDWPLNAFLDQGVFLRHMACGDLGSEFCSPFLVNAVLSNACVSSCLLFGVWCGWRGIWLRLWVCC